MNVLLFGGDSATHVLAWKLVNSAAVDEVLVAPGNGGTTFFASSVALAPDANAVTSFVLGEGIELVVTNGAAAATGLPDELRALPLPVIGPGHALWPLHASRCAAREWLAQAGLPLPRGRVCTSRSEAEKFAATLQLPLLIAAAERGSLALQCAGRADVRQAVAECFAVSQGSILVEEIVPGPLVTAALLFDGATAVSVPAARVYPAELRQYDNLDGALGVHAAATPLWAKLESFLEAQVRQPLAAALGSFGAAARGWVSATCVVGPRGPLVQTLRFVPAGLELAATLPRLDGDLLPLLLGCARGTLAAVEAPRWSAEAIVGVALRAAGESPGDSPLPGGAFDTFDPGTLVFHHTTPPSALNLYQPRHARQTTGRYGWASPPSNLPMPAGAEPPAGSAATAFVIATAPDLAEARARVYANLGRVPLPQLSYDTGIGVREL